MSTRRTAPTSGGTLSCTLHPAALLPLGGCVSVLLLIVGYCARAAEAPWAAICINVGWTLLVLVSAIFLFAVACVFVVFYKEGSV